MILSATFHRHIRYPRRCRKTSRSHDQWKKVSKWFPFPSTILHHVRYCHVQLILWDNSFCCIFSIIWPCVFQKVRNIFGTEQFSPKNLPRSFVRAEPLIRLIEFARKLEKSLEQNNLVLRTLTWRITEQSQAETLVPFPSQNNGLD